MPIMMERLHGCVTSSSHLHMGTLRRVRLVFDELQAVYEKVLAQRLLTYDSE